MLTKENFTVEWEQARNNVPEWLREMYNSYHVKEVFEFIHEDETCAEAIDKFCAAVNASMDKGASDKKKQVAVVKAKAALALALANHLHE